MHVMFKINYDQNETNDYYKQDKINVHDQKHKTHRESVIKDTTNNRSLIVCYEVKMKYEKQVQDDKKK